MWVFERGRIVCVGMGGNWVCSEAVERWECWGCDRGLGRLYVPIGPDKYRISGYLSQNFSNTTEMVGQAAEVEQPL
jgi:hypothetical protein